MQWAWCSGQLIAICSSSFWGSNTLFWPPKVPGMHTKHNIYPGKSSIQMKKPTRIINQSVVPFGYFCVTSHFQSHSFLCGVATNTIVRLGVPGQLWATVR